MSEVRLVSGPEEAGAVVAAHIALEAGAAPGFVLGLATGASPLPLYRRLGALVAEGLDLTHVRCFALDEYVGLSAGHPQSFRAVIEREVVTPLRLDPAKVHVPDGDAAHVETAGARYERAIVQAGGIDLQLAGIGANGHIGFNEPGSSLASPTRMKTLTDRTRRANAGYFGSIEAVPVHCVTQGLGTILRSRHLVLLAFGVEKAPAIAAALEGPVTASLPASVVQLHPHATVFVDEAAAARLSGIDYHRRVQALKPSWQGL